MRVDLARSRLAHNGAGAARKLRAQRQDERHLLEAE